MSATGKGFTLLELLVVLAILTLLVSSMPFAADRLFPRQRLRATATEIAVTLRDLRQRAELEGTPAAFKLVESGQAWQTSGEAQSARFPRGLAARLIPATPGDLTELRFFPDGSSTGGTITLTLADRKALVRVSPMTSRIRAEDAL
jgi:general secretion pathway protein H